MQFALWRTQPFLCQTACAVVDEQPFGDVVAVEKQEREKKVSQGQLEARLCAEISL